MLQEIKVSVLIPVYNVEFYLERCFDSVIHQSLKEIEILVVDDASNDRSSKIIEKYEREDSRIKFLRHNVNKGSMAARFTALKAARGEAIIFLDGDDELHLEACEIAYRKIKEADVDIFQFGVEIMCPFERAKKEADLFFMPIKEGRHSTKEIFKMVLTQRKSWSLWGKIYRCSLFKDVHKDFSFDQNITVSEDVYLYFYLLLHAKTYLGSNKTRLYTYHFDNGITAPIPIKTIEKWKGYPSLLHALDGLLKLFKEFSVDEVYKNEIKDLIQEQIAWMLSRLYYVCVPEIREEAFNMVISKNMFLKEISMLLAKDLRNIMYKVQSIEAESVIIIYRKNFLRQFYEFLKGILKQRGFNRGNIFSLRLFFLIIKQLYVLPLKIFKKLLS